MRRIALVAGAVVITLLPLLVPALPAAAATDPNSPTLRWGSYAAPRSGEGQQSAVTHLETNIGRQFAVTREFLLWDYPFPTSFHTWLRSTNHTLIVSVKAQYSNGTRIPWADLAAAAPGSKLYNDTVTWAHRMRDFGVPLYFTFNHEPEAAASSSNGTATDFINAWRKVVDIFRQEGASNVKFMWIMTDYSFDVPPSDRRQAVKWFPGDNWVDGLGADAYNWYTCRTGIDTPWRSLATIIENFRKFGLAHPAKEMWLTEWASTEDPAAPGRKAQWISDAEQLFKQPGYEQLRGVSYFHSGYASGSFANCKWWVDSSQSALNAFSSMGGDVFYTATTGTPPPPPPPPPPTKSALLVAGSTTLGADDAAVRSRLVGLGYTVTVADDDTATAADASGKDVVLISNSGSSTALTTKFRDVAVPVVLWKPSIYDDMGMTAPNDWGTTNTAQMAVTNPLHALAAGLSGTVAIVSSSATLPWGNPLSSADKIGTVGAHPSLFAYRPGYALAGGRVAAACRIAFPAYTGAVSRYTGNGWSLFDEAVTWADTGC